jgi:hypothetical protein
VGPIDAPASALALDVFGIVGATNVANATKEFSSAQSVRLQQAHDAGHGAHGATPAASQLPEHDHRDAARD